MDPDRIIRKRIESQLNTHELWIRVKRFVIDEEDKEDREKKPAMDGMK